MLEAGQEAERPLGAEAGLGAQWRDRSGMHQNQQEGSEKFVVGHKDVLEPVLLSAALGTLLSALQEPRTGSTPDLTI